MISILNQKYSISVLSRKNGKTPEITPKIYDTSIKINPAKYRLFKK